jgi:glycosyltransferase involved in cell wall biosynthesis
MSKKIKVLAISYLYPNSAYPNFGIFVHNRLKAVNRYCDIKVINPIPWFPFLYLFNRYKGYDQIPQKEMIDGIEVYHPRFFIIPRFFKFLDAFTFCMAIFSVVVRLKKTYSFDLIDLHWTYPDLLSGFLLYKLFRKPYLVTVRGKEALNLFVQEEKTTYTKEHSLRSAMTILLLRRSSAVITLSYELKELCTGFGIAEKNINIITNGIDVKRFYYMPKIMARKKLQFESDTIIILAVGALIYGKGFDRLLNLLPELQKNYEKAVVYIIGSEGPAGAYKKELITLCLRNGIACSIHFIGQIPNDELTLWYNAADLFCLSSRGEGSPNVLYEALACGCPCVATDVGSASEILNLDDLGIIIDNDDAALLPGIRSALSRSYERKTIAHYMRQHNWDICAQKVIKIYEQLLI